MKRFFPIIISVILIISMLFTGCSSSSEETSVSTKDAYAVNHDLLESVFTENADTLNFDKFADTVSSWAEKNSIDILTVNDKYLVLSKDGSGELKNVESFTFHSCMDFTTENSLKTSIDSAATVMTAIGSAHNHGPISAIFTLFENGQAKGAAALNTDYLDYDNFIDVTYGKNAVIYNSFAALSNMSAVKELNITVPTYSKAYRIDFNGVSNQSAYKNRNAYPNPIKTIGDLLASCQTSTVLFELASFNGGSVTGLIPDKVTATIVLHENDVQSFTKKFENSHKKVSEIYKESDDENVSFEYTMTPVDLPSEVISKEDTENIVSLMYTMINGTYLRNESDEIEAYSSIGRISTANGTFKLDISARSLNDELMNELESVVKTICGLSDINYKKISSSKVWTNDPETPLVSSLSSELNADCSSVLEMKHISEFTNKNSNINLISWGTNSEDAAKDLEKIFEYMSIAGTHLTTEN